MPPNSAVNVSIQYYTTSSRLALGLTFVSGAASGAATHSAAARAGLQASGGLPDHCLAVNLFRSVNERVWLGRGVGQRRAPIGLV